MRGKVCHISVTRDAVILKKILFIDPFIDIED